MTTLMSNRRWRRTATATATGSTMGESWVTGTIVRYADGCRNATAASSANAAPRMMQATVTHRIWTRTSSDAARYRSTRLPTAANDSARVTSPRTLLAWANPLTAGTA